MLMPAPDREEASPRKEIVTMGNMARKGLVDMGSRVLLLLLGTVGVISPPLVMMMTLDAR